MIIGTCPRCHGPVVFEDEPTCIICGWAEYGTLPEIIVEANKAKGGIYSPRHSYTMKEA